MVTSFLIMPLTLFLVLYRWIPSSSTHDENSTWCISLHSLSQLPLKVCPKSSNAADIWLRRGWRCICQLHLKCHLTRPAELLLPHCWHSLNTFWMFRLDEDLTVNRTEERKRQAVVGLCYLPLVCWTHSSRGREDEQFHLCSIYISNL